MRKLKYFSAILIIVTAVASCEKVATDESNLEVMMKSAIVIDNASDPVSFKGIVPQIIKGANRGGNVTCNEVASVYGTTFDLCWDKLDYGDFDANGTFEFNGAFPEGLTVTTDGRFVSFLMTECVSIGDKYYKIGAVIVKGSNNANIYYYPDGMMSDSGLAAPYNSSGSPAGLSNLTFCLVECEEELPELVIVLKTYIQHPVGQFWAGTIGTGSEINSLHLGYVTYHYNGLNSFTLYGSATSSWPVGTLTASDYVEDGVRYLEIVVTCDEDGLLFLDSHLFVGTAAGYNNYLTTADGITYTDYLDFPFFENDIAATRVFKIPFTELDL